MGCAVEVTAHRLAGARDEVLVAILPDGSGLISYRRTDGSVLHTLGTRDAMRRKLGTLGLVVVGSRALPIAGLLPPELAGALDGQSSAELCSLLEDSAIPAAARAHVAMVLAHSRSPELRAELGRVLVRVLTAAGVPCELGEAAMVALAHLGPAAGGEASRALEAVMHSDAYSLELRTAAARALGEVADRNALLPLEWALETKANPLELRLGAAFALAGLELAAAERTTLAGLLERLLADRSEPAMVRATVAALLAQLSPEDLELGARIRVALAEIKVCSTPDPGATEPQP